jgi:hypothetical protein
LHALEVENTSLSNREWHQGSWSSSKRRQFHSSRLNITRAGQTEHCWDTPTEDCLFFTRSSEARRHS